MAKTTKKKEAVKETAPVVTRAEKKDATKNLIKETLAVKPLRHNELMDAVANLYVERFSGEDSENINDVKGRVGSVLDIMKKDGDVTYEGGMYALKAQEVAEKPTKKTAKKAPAKAEEPAIKEEKASAKKPSRAKKTAETQEDKPAKKATKAKTKKAEPLPPAPLQPIAPVDPITPETMPETPKKRGRKAKAVQPVEEAPAAVAMAEPAVAPVVETMEEPTVTPQEPISAPVAEEIVLDVQAEEKPVETVAEVIVPAEEKSAEIPEKTEEPKQLIVKEKAEVAKKNVVMDMSFLFGDRKPAKQPEKTEEAPAVEAEKPQDKPQEKPAVQAVKTEKQETKPERKAPEKPQTKPVEKRAEKPQEKPQEKSQDRQEKPNIQTAVNVRKLTKESVRAVRKVQTKPQTSEERLREAFLKRLRTLSGEYFEYYSVYLLERYSMKNGRRLEGLKICGGDHDGGIDGEIELTDKLGFRETIYIQSKNWNPDKGDEKLWVVGETLLQQFIGACACRQAKDGKQHCRGIFVTTSRFTPEAKRVLDAMSDKIVGYDGTDLYEAAKECSFGLIEKNGEWVLDERLLSGEKAFFNLY